MSQEARAAGSPGVSDKTLGRFVTKPGSISAYWPEVGAAIILASSYVLLAGMPLSHDVVWQLWIARQLNSGVGLYSWIMEVNPPLWYWMAQPIELLSRAFDVPANAVMVLAVFLCIGVSLLLTAVLAADWRAPERAVLIGSFLFAAIAVCVSDFAQREQQCFIAAVPYALLMARRAEAKPVPMWLALFVGLFAAPFIALKHYFVLVPLALEAWLIVRRRRAWCPVRPETIMLGLGAAVYAGAILSFAPDYLSKLVPLLRLSYGDLRMIIQPALLNRMTLGLVVSAFFFWNFRNKLDAVTTAFLLIKAAFTASYFLQFKGWGYHIDPVVASLVMATCALLSCLQRKEGHISRKEAVLGALGPLIAMYSVLLQGPYHNAYRPYAEELLSPLKAGMTAVMLTTKPSKIWPMVDEKGLIWPSRYLHFWMMQSVANSQMTGESMTPLLARLADEVRLQTVEDFACNPPDMIIDDKASIDGVPFDILQFFLEEPRFASLFASYQATRTIGPFTAYQRTNALPAPQDGDACVSITPLEARH